VSVTLPTGQQIEIHDISARLLVVPIGTVLRVPDGHEWYLMSVAVLPTRGYVSPLGTGETRDARAWGDLQIRMNDASDALFRANVLTLIDRYWGRFNLNPMLPELAARLTAAQQALHTAPKISEMYTLLDHLVIKYQQYLDTAAPKLETSVTLRSGVHYAIEHVAAEAGVAEMLVDSELGAVPVKVTRALDVELSLMVKRPVS